MGMNTTQANLGEGKRLEGLGMRLMATRDRIALIEDMTTANAIRILGHEVEESGSSDRDVPLGCADGALGEIDEVMIQITRALDHLENSARRFNQL
jgi:hypothetical protein